MAIEIAAYDLITTIRKVNAEYYHNNDLTSSILNVKTNLIYNI